MHTQDCDSAGWPRFSPKLLWLIYLLRWQMEICPIASIHPTGKLREKLEIEELPGASC
jgi:hypothetical protein